MKGKADIRVMLVVLGVLLVLVVGAGLLVIVVARGRGGPVELLLRLKAGQSYAVQTDLEQELSQTGGPMGSVKMVMAIGSDWTWHVESVDEGGNATIKVTQDAARVSMSMPPEVDLSYDSASASEEPPSEARPFAALVGQSYTMKVSPQGRVLELTGVEEMLEEAVAGLGSQGVQAAMTAQLVRGLFGEEALKSGIEGTLGIYPPGPVRVGDSWQKDRSLSAPVPLSITSLYTLKKRSGGEATIAVEADVTAAPDSAPEEVQAPIKISGTQKGNMQVDEATGCISGGEVRQTFTLSLSGPGASGEVTGQFTARTRMGPK